MTDKCQCSLSAVLYCSLVSRYGNGEWMGHFEIIKNVYILCHIFPDMSHLKVPVLFTDNNSKLIQYS